MATHQELSNFIWQIADLLRGPYRPPQYERVMLPLTVLRRFDCVLEPTKARVLAEHARREQLGLPEAAIDAMLNKVSGQRFHNHSPLTFEGLKGDPDQIDRHLSAYIHGFSANVAQIFERFDFFAEVEKMRDANILYLIVSKFCDLDLHPDAVDNLQMGLLFEDLIRRFNEQANETAGDHFTPREVIQLMVDLVFTPDDDALARPGTVRTLLDPACGTGGMLAEAQNHLSRQHAQADLYVYGQDFNPRAYAMAAADLLIKGRENSRIEFGDTLTEDKFAGDTFDYFLANPPFGVDWKRQQAAVTREHDKQGYGGRFGAGLPRVNDGSLLFLQHMLAKFEPVRPDERKYGSRLAVVFSGSPLFSGGAGSGESGIRQWIIENDWLEAVVALPEQMFYNTGIGTYVWVVTNRKDPARRGKIQLLDGRARWKPMRRSFGDKRRYLGADDIAALVRAYGLFAETADSKLFDNEDFGYTRVTVERPLRLRFAITLERKGVFLDALPHLLGDVQAIDAALGREVSLDWNETLAAVQSVLKARKSRWRASDLKLFREVFADRDPAAAPVVLKREPLPAGAGGQGQAVSGGVDTSETQATLFDTHPLPSGEGRRSRRGGVVRLEPDPALRDFENVPLTQDVDDYFAREVLPHVPDAWMDREKDKTGYEINFNRHFYAFTPPRPLETIDAELRAVEADILKMLQEVTV